NPCQADGVPYTTMANGRLLRETPFEKLYVQPAAGDSGGALGAALYAYHVLLGKPRRFVMEHAYWGSSYEPSQIKSALDALGVGYEIVEREEALLDRAVEASAAGRSSAGRRGASNGARGRSAIAASWRTRARRR